MIMREKVRSRKVMNGIGGRNEAPYGVFKSTINDIILNETVWVSG